MLFALIACSHAIDDSMLVSHCSAKFVLDTLRESYAMEDWEIVDNMLTYPDAVALYEQWVGL